MHGDTVAWMREQAGRLDAVVCGSVVIEEKGAYFNRFVWVAPAGDVAWYDKRHRFRMAGEHEHYSAGTQRVILQLDGWRVCPLVCYDLRFPVWLRNRSDYDLLLCVANWPAARRTAWLTLLAARAIENQAYAVGVNIIGTDGAGVAYSGDSRVFSPTGEVLARAEDSEAVVTCTLSGAPLSAVREAFPVWQDADEFRLLE